MSGQTYTCDCGLNYSHPDQVIACANNMHGMPATSAELRDEARSEIARLTKERDDLRDALQFVRWELQSGRVSQMMDYIDTMLTNTEQS